MKVILSRKGCDDRYGGCPSPIFPDKTMLSLPIPGLGSLTYSELEYNGLSYKDILKQLKTSFLHEKCHLDPDIRENVRKIPAKNWQAAFGQTDKAQTHLENQKVGVGDLFLFFGTFQEVDFVNGIIKKQKLSTARHIIFGYLQIGEILKGENVEKCIWHPHADRRIHPEKNNTIYLASKKLIINGYDSGKKGYGTFDYSPSRVLTKHGMSKSRWELPDFFKTVPISCHSSDSFKSNYFQSVCIGQEIVIEANRNVISWTKKIIEST